MTISTQNFRELYLRKLQALTTRTLEDASDLEQYTALAALLKEQIAIAWGETNRRYREEGRKQVYYFSMEFLTGKFLRTNLHCLGLYETAHQAFAELGVSLDKLIDTELEQGLGNGGLGRLAACFMDAIASQGYAGHGCGIRYKNGLFEQRIVDGHQVEFPDRWLTNDNVWEIKRESKAVLVEFYGKVEPYMEDDQLRFRHTETQKVRAVPYDTPMVGYRNDTVNTLRLWSAEAVESNFDFDRFSKGNYLAAFEHKHSAEIISQILYPNDSFEEGKLLRLKQEYFFVSAGLQSILASYRRSGRPILDFHRYVAIHINDTHPALAVPELMRLLMDVEGLGWDTAWEITTQTISYTNHTILAEALEKWPVYMIRELLPRIMMIIDEINRRFVDQLRHEYGYREEKVHRMAIIADEVVRMAYLAIIGSHSVNGVAKLHTEILKKKELKDFYKLEPSRFNNKTNGIMHRLWLNASNPKLAELIRETIGRDFAKEPTALLDLMKHKDDAALQDAVAQIKHQNKERLADYVKQTQGIVIDPHSIFDVQAKRIHEYKRQHLNVLQIMHLYNRLLENPNLDIPPRTFLFAGKSAPGYYIAKQIIKLINTVGSLVNGDTRIQDKLKVVFLPNYSVSMAGILIPAADVSEQISTASKEASGTGNMKFMMNGAITLATLDGANVEIMDEVGDNNIVIFGLRDEEVYNYYQNRNYSSIELYRENPDIRRVVDQLTDGFLPAPREEFVAISDRLLKHNDEFFVLKDFDSYCDAQERI
ncbi:MAG: glycogen/starch/alpha-glucan phosphorylase, partial [Bacillota bacterium]|nr:glycogen/starch/alpha-glucan phosphorylase [Bacillota bacterium]